MFDAILTSEAMFFTVPALAGTAVFALKLIFMLAGGLDADADLELGGDVDLDAVDGGDSTEAFKLLSILAVAAFLMGFGWTGLGGRLGLGWGFGPSILLAAGGGGGMVWLLGLLLKAIHDLEASGTVEVRDAVGGEGTIYARVPAAGEGSGQVRVVIRERDRIYTAVSENGPLPTNTRVRVIGLDGPRTLTVTAG